MKPTLYLMVGYPGAGKTTTALVIHKLTGAEHIWADHERIKMFGSPTHSQAEHRQLYGALNGRVNELLTQGKSVIFDTNFNYRRDRDRLRATAEQAGAETKIVWLTTDKETAYRRATADSEGQPTRLFGNMPHEDFERMAGHLQPPTDDENPIKLDGTNLTEEYIRQSLGI